MSEEQLLDRGLEQAHLWLATTPRKHAHLPGNKRTFPTWDCTFLRLRTSELSVEKSAKAYAFTECLLVLDDLSKHSIGHDLDLDVLVLLRHCLSLFASLPIIKLERTRLCLWRDVLILQSALLDKSIYGALATCFCVHRL